MSTGAFLDGVILKISLTAFWNKGILFEFNFDKPGAAERYFEWEGADIGR